MHKLLIDRLLASAPVAAICDDRINWGLNPQGTGFPRVRLTLISEPREYHLKGEVGLFFALVQVDAFADDYLEACRLRNAIVADLSGQRWDRVRLVTIGNQRDGTHIADAKTVFHVIIDLRVIYKGA